MRPAKPQAERQRGGGYGKDLHDTSGKTWLHGGDPSEKPGYDKGRAGQQQKRRKSWPY
jgi:hypothetical protein